jgi:hypothetical protein
MTTAAFPAPSRHETLHQYFLEVYLDERHYQDARAGRSTPRAMARAVAADPEQALRMHMRTHHLLYVYHAQVRTVEEDIEQIRTFDHYHLVPPVHLDLSGACVQASSSQRS